MFLKKLPFMCFGLFTLTLTMGNVNAMLKETKSATCITVNGLNGDDEKEARCNPCDTVQNYLYSCYLTHLAGTEAMYDALWEPAGTGRLSAVLEILDALSVHRLRSTHAIDNAFIIAVRFNQANIITYLLNDQSSTRSITCDGAYQALAAAYNGLQYDTLLLLLDNDYFTKLIKARSNTEAERKCIKAAEDAVELDRKSSVRLIEEEDDDDDDEKDEASA